MNPADPKHLAPILEALLLASGKPLSLERLAELFEEHERPTPAQLKKALALLDKRCAESAMQLREVASGYRLQVRAEYANWVGRLWEERPQRYSRALLETLALIAYRQPITRGEIEDVALRDSRIIAPVEALEVLALGEPRESEAALEQARVSAVELVLDEPGEGLEEVHLVVGDLQGTGLQGGAHAREAQVAQGALELSGRHGHRGCPPVSG